MRDAFATLAKLPEKCASVQNGAAVFIRRGAREVGPAHIPSTQVDQWNLSHGIAQHVRLAMEAGLALGWDADAADPDMQLGTRGCDYSYTYATEIAVQVTVIATSEESAYEKMKITLDDAVDLLRDHYEVTNLSFGRSDTSDLIETDDPR